MTYRHPSLVNTGLAAAPRRTTASANDDRRNERFVTQSHALGGSAASPGALLIAAAVAVAVFVLGLRISRG